MAGASLLSLLIKVEETDGRAQEMDLRFWEIHRLGPYLIVQSQYVLVNKRALRVEQRRDSEKHEAGTLNYRCGKQNV